MDIAYCANRNLYHLLPTTLNSLLSNNKIDGNIYLLIEDDDIEFIQHPQIKFININQFDFIIRSGVNCTRKFPYTALVRCFFTYIFPNHDQLLYLDVDTVVDGSIEELLTMRLGSNCIAARSENPVQSDRPIPLGYFNSGVAVFNLKMIRLLKLDSELVRLLKTCNLVFPDQDALNFVLKDRVTYIDEKFNVLGGDSVYHNEIVIRHYAGLVKPWKDDATQKDKDFWNKYKVSNILEL